MDRRDRPMERIDKLLSATGRWSRQEAKRLCREGRVRAGDTVAASGEVKVDPSARITVDGEPVETGRALWLMLHKPAGVVCATRDVRQATVFSLLPEEYGRMGLFPVGRLDRDTEGLLLLTNDGEAAHRLLSPKRHVDKVYYVEVEGELGQPEAAAFAGGLTLADGSRCLPARLDPLGGGRGRITLREGKYHQIKRMLGQLGRPVVYLKRTAFGPLTLDPALERGKWRTLTAEERRLLEAAVGGLV